MNPLHRFALLLALLGTTAQADDHFRIMDEAEMARHHQQLATLQGQAREDYRNRVWQALRERAHAHGYDMPETPPWAASAGPLQTAGAPTAQQSSAEASEAVSEDMEKRVQRHRQVIEQAAEAETTQHKPMAAERSRVSAATRQYRQQMRERFERFMAQRRARQEQARRQREQARAQREAARRQQQQPYRPPAWAPRPPVQPAPPGWPGYAPQRPPAWPAYPPAPAPRPPYWY